MGEGEVVNAGFVVGGFGEEVPGEQLGILDLAVGTVLADGPLVGHACDEIHGEGLELDVGVDYGEEKLAGEESAGGMIGGAVEDEGG